MFRSAKIIALIFLALLAWYATTDLADMAGLALRSTFAWMFPEPLP